ncbi:MAG: dihydrodipicolinate synthase family protein [Kiritimatiellia bacterium]
MRRAGLWAAACAVAFAAGAAKPMRGPFPLLCTPWTAEGALDCEVLAKEAAFVSACGAAGVVWPTAGEVDDLVREGEYVKGLDALAARAARPDFAACLTAVCPGGTSAQALDRVREVNAAMGRHNVEMAILARPPDDARTQTEIEAHYRQLARIAKCPVIIQTYNGKSPQPDVALLVRLAKDYPAVHGFVKEESPGGKVNARIAQLVAAKPAIKTVFSGWGAKGWLYQGRALGTEGVITQRPAYADLLAKMWAEGQKGDPDGRLTDLYAKYLLMTNLGDTFGGTADQMRGPHLYVLMRRGIFTNTYTRRRPPKGDISGKKWIVESVTLSPAEKAEIDRRLVYCGLLPDR